MDWKYLLNEETLAVDENPEPKEWQKYEISGFEKDYKKIVASSAFRRLQDKTQVFPLDKSDFVRTRLTHSMEVSMIAKQLGTMVCTYISNSDKYENSFSYNKNTAKYIGEVLMCAGLLHDLGNPPFGHFGETIIGYWFRERLADKNFKFIYESDGKTEEKEIGSFLSSQMCRDLEHFEGNAQSLRLLLKSFHEGSVSDLNLTHTVIHTLMKYPVDSEHFCKTDPNIKNHKNGYFKAEEDILLKISNLLGTDELEEVVRHPLTYLLEAADDIAYATADLEDAFKKNLFTLEAFVLFFDEKHHDISGENRDPKVSQLIEPFRNAVKEKSRLKENDMRVFNDWVKFARGWLMYCAAFGFTSNYSAIMKGTYTHDAFHGTFHEPSIEILKSAMVKFAYHSEDIVKLELSADTIITSLLDKFVPAVLYLDDKKRQSSANRKLVDLISENYKSDYYACRRENEPEYNLYLRFLMVTDYISGMTDSYAKNLYQELNGII